MSWTFWRAGTASSTPLIRDCEARPAVCIQNRHNPAQVIPISRSSPTATQQLRPVGCNVDTMQMGNEAMSARGPACVKTASKCSGANFSEFSNI